MKPTTLRSITLDELDKIQLDDKNNLYWDGVPIQTRINLSWWIDMFAALAGVGTFGTFLIELLKLFTSK